MSDLLLYRMNIDSVDKEIVKLLDTRFSILKNVSDYKKKNKLPITDLGREHLLLSKLESTQMTPESLEYIMSAIIEAGKQQYYKG